MHAVPPTVVLLGPQRSDPTLPAALAAAGVAGPLAAITAGWEDREGETERLDRAVGRPVENLRLHHAAEIAFARDRELLEAYRARRALLRASQAAYRTRLGHLLVARAELRVAGGPSRVLAGELSDALEMVRALDRGHLERAEAIETEFADRWRPGERDAIRVPAEQMRRVIDGAAAVLVAGGHVPILRNRLRLFGLADALATRPCFAWSGGAMALAERILLFHDRPPQGEGHAEVMGRGLALVSGVVLLPDASARLAIEDRTRVETLARRLLPERGIVLDPGCGVRIDGERITSAAGGAWRLGLDGTLEDALEETLEDARGR